ncbi:site-specific DNA-methyltransferase [Leptotrichia buccalis]|uniref:Site-specific DNA-methyltransferase (Adenine-specific) n=1 Tax=Leptotrichia buccalis (strain ATCC 14201 / DSM 1135 / JCM 12969 / NCTC 10249 / C-1013-b) TaxID=523794 RepID=C7ND07_LEPBD|nr:site-specific DNA-methyltransferase [Leptotrichia buccalis]ACV38077.1 Site-specific DNA-methyltransferase (adenine- specific) [Leptotrichia buccalis C-1013-b]
MENNKIKKEINDIVNDNLKALEQLFPSAVKDGQLDIKALKEELGDFEEVTTEKYELNWSGKQNAKKIVQQGIGNKTLKFVAKDSKNADTTENIYIEGDNLEVLKLLRQNYYNSIKMIYIDPPYNTGNDFVYNDTFKMDKEESDKAEGIISENNEKLQKNQKSTNRYHANWLNMMYPRLKLARDLLTDDGVIFISIDDNEQANLKRLCDEIFGEENFVEIFSWQKTSTPPNLSKKTKKSVEYILCYQKNECKTLKGLVKESKSTNGLMNQSNSIGTLVFPHESVETSIKNEKLEKGIYGTESYVIELLSDVEIRNGKFLNDIILKGKFKWSQDYLEEQIKLGTKIFIKTKALSPSYEKEEYDPEKPWNIIDKNFGVGTNENASDELDNLFYKNFSDKLYPKPTSLITYLLNMLELENNIILDFFSGSATTAHAIMQLNSEDDGNRKYIMVQLPETTDEKSEAFKAGYKNIADIGKERIRRAGEKIKQEIEEYNSNLKLEEEPKKVPDIGFKVFKVDDTNIKWYDLENFNEESQYSFDDPDSLDFVLGSNDIDIVYEIMLRQNDVPLSENLEVLTNIGNRTYLYASTYLICLETEITEEMVEKLASLEPLPIKFVFRDSAFKDNISLKDETFRKLRSLIERNSGESKVSYRVEFI